MASDQILPEFATDFLGNEIRVGDTVVYPTGGSSCRMVRAIVREVRDFREHCYQCSADTYDKANRVWIKKTHKVWHSHAGHNGHMGPIAFKIQVTREQEGAHLAGLAGDPATGYWGIDDAKKVTVDQLHRVVSVTALERKARSTHIIEVGDDMPHVFPPSADKLPPLQNIPLWGDGDI